MGRWTHTHTHTQRHADPWVGGLHVGVPVLVRVYVNTEVHVHGV
jgi:hypothetical protein